MAGGRGGVGGARGFAGSSGSTNFAGRSGSANGGSAGQAGTTSVAGASAGGFAGSNMATAGGAGIAGSANTAGGAGTAGEAGVAGEAGAAGAPSCGPCTAPPPECIDAQTLRRYDTGSCSLDTCEFSQTDSVCLAGCNAGRCLDFAVSISEGSDDVCATVNHGPLKCWGSNFNGPAVMPGLESGVRQVSLGTDTACALMDSGEVKCWTFPPTVTTVSGLPSDITSIACAAPYFDHTCVLSPSMGVLCWGANNFGQLGNGMTLPSFYYQSAITAVIDLPLDVTSITAGSNDTCAITGGGDLWCWGMNRYGELGIGNFDTSTTPVEVSGFTSGTLAVSAGEEYTCAITPDHTVRCWGWDASGNGNVATAVDVAGTDDMATISVDGAGCGITTQGALKCWGPGAFGHLGNGSTAASYTQAVDPIGMSAGVVAVAVGEYGVCDVLETGAIYCWGSGPNGGRTPTLVAGF